MKKLTQISLIGTLVLCSGFAQASVIEISQNMNSGGTVTPGAQIYLPTTPSGLPIPHQALGTADLPMPLNYFANTDDIRIATQYSLQDLEASDTGIDDMLDWSYAFEHESGLTVSGTVSIDWLTVDNEKSLGKEAINFSSNDYFQDCACGGFVTEGTWIGTTSLEGISSPNGPFTFTVVEPGSLALLGLGLAMVGRRKAKNSKV